MPEQNLYLNEISPWERIREHHNVHGIKEEVSEQTVILKKMLVNSARDYPLSVAEQVPYGSYLDANQYNMFEICDAVSRSASDITSSLDSGFSMVGEKIDHQSEVTKKGFVGLAVAQAATMAISTNAITGAIEANSNLIASTVTQSGLLIQEKIDFLTETIHEDLAELSDQIYEFHSSFNIAMGNIEAHFELVENKLQTGFDSICEILKTRRKVEATEHFEDALGFYKDGNRFSQEPQWFDDAKKHFRISLNLYSRNPLAHLYLAHIYHYQKKQRNLEKALNHYRLCGIYGEAEESTRVIAARGYHYAGWLSAVANNDYQTAIKYAKKARLLDCDLIQARYFLAKYYVVTNNTEEVVKLLKDLILNFDKFYAIKALTDPDMKKAEKLIVNLVCDLRENEKKKFTILIKQINAIVKATNYEWVKDEVDEFNKAVKIAKQRNGYIDYLDANDFLAQKKVDLKNIIQTNQEREDEERREKEEEERWERERKLREEKKKKKVDLLKAISCLKEEAKKKFNSLEKDIQEIIATENIIEKYNSLEKEFQSFQADKFFSLVLIFDLIQNEIDEINKVISVTKKRNKYIYYLDANLYIAKQKVDLKKLIEAQCVALNKTREEQAEKKQREQDEKVKNNKIKQLRKRRLMKKKKEARLIRLKKLNIFFIFVFVIAFVFSTIALLKNIKY